MTNQKDIAQIKEKELKIAEKFPKEAQHHSKCTLWTEGWRAGIVDKELYDKARDYYGRSWVYGSN